MEGLDLWFITTLRDSLQNGDRLTGVDFAGLACPLVLVLACRSDPYHTLHPPFRRSCPNERSSGLVRVLSAALGHRLDRPGAGRDVGRLTIKPCRFPV